MQYVSALALASLSGKPATKESINAILSATGKPVDAKQIQAVLASLKGRTIEDVISKGLTKVSTSAPAAKTQAPKKQQKKQQPKKEEPKKAPEPAPPADDEDFGMDLFG